MIVTLALRTTGDQLHINIFQKLDPTQRLGATTPAEISRTRANGHFRGSQIKFGVAKQPDTAEINRINKHTPILA